jgi:potassium-transporting ATPase KdpC subunit
MLLQHIRTALLLLIALTIGTGIFYPLAMTWTAGLLFPHAANGSMITRDGQTVGSELIGQQFRNPGYFWSRPSATSPVPYNAAGSTGSNLGPANPALHNLVQMRVSSLHDADPGNRMLVPVDLVTSSGSGLDPHITIAAAEYQVHRVAAARHLREDQVRSLVERFTEERQFGFLGEPRVNVIRLNLALDEFSPLLNN